MSIPINKTAVALEYDGASAPTISATGTEAAAQQIIALALEHGVPLYENPELASLLATLELGESIPESLYVCIAQIIAFAYKIRGKVPEDWKPQEASSAAIPALPKDTMLLLDHEPPVHEDNDDFFDDIKEPNS